MDFFGARSSTIAKVTTLAALFALIFLVLEVPLVILAKTATNWDSTIIAVGTLAAIITAIVVVGLVALRQPTIFQDKTDAGETSRSKPESDRRNEITPNAVLAISPKARSERRVTDIINAPMKVQHGIIFVRNVASGTILYKRTSMTFVLPGQMMRQHYFIYQFTAQFNSRSGFMQYV